MGQFNKKKKIKTIYNIQIQNDLDLDQKSNTAANPKVEALHFKKPRTLYDSGWISCTGSGDSSFIPVSIPSDENNWGQLDYYETQTSIIGKKVPLNLFYHFMNDIRLPQRLIPFVNVSFMIKNPPTMEPIPMPGFRRQQYGNNYYEIRAGGNLVYKGYDPYTYYHSDTEIDRGDLSAANCSKWYNGTVEYTDGGDSYQLIGDLQYIVIYYDTVFVSEANNYNYKYFFTQTFDNISGSSVTGQGSAWTGTWKETSPGSHSWYLDLSDVSHEVDRTVNVLGAGNTVDVVVNGVLFKNSVHQNGSSFFLRTNGNIHPGGIAGTATITSWNFSQKTVFDDPDDKLYKLHYSSRRLRQVIINSFPQEYTLGNLPESTDIDAGASLPFTSASIKVNPDPYPMIAEEDSFINYFQPASSQIWARVSPKDAKKEIWRFFLTGFLYFLVPATLNIPIPRPCVDESYSFNGSVFERDSENRPGKDMAGYVPDTYTIQMRLVLTLANPQYYQNQQRLS